MSKILLKLKDEKGQNLVEFALIVGILLAIFFGITEFARAWYRADRLKNAANIAARTYAVTKNWNNDPPKPGMVALFAAYSAMGTTAVTVTPDPNPPDPNGTSIKVTVSEDFQSVVSGIPALGGTTIPIIGNITLTRDATYRME